MRYLLRDDGEEVVEGDGIFFHVSDAKGAFIGIRAEPDVNSTRTGLQLQPGEARERWTEKASRKTNYII